MPRNLVVCLDGTDNEFCANNTNVVRLYESLESEDSKQLSYYHPGVGTMAEPGTISKTWQKTQMILGLAFGLGVTRNVSEAYEFLMRYHQPEDRIFIFGFSRGALEARALAALIHRCGLLHPHLSSLTPYAVQMSQTFHKDDVAEQFTLTFSRRLKIHFLGLWDTVTSMGNVWSPIRWPYTADNPSVLEVSHAIAIDEQRSFFRQNRWGGRIPCPGQVVSEAWFAGVHSDVGGGYTADTGRLWAITFDWMTGRASAAGLHLNDAKVQSHRSAGKQAGDDTPDFATDQHDSLTRAWKLLELVPKPHRTRNSDGTYGPERPIIPWRTAGFTGRPRTLSPGEKVHRSALARFAWRADYRPPTLVNGGLTLEEARRFLSTNEEAWTVPPQPPPAN